MYDHKRLTMYMLCSLQNLGNGSPEGSPQKHAPPTFMEYDEESDHINVFKDIDMQEHNLINVSDQTKKTEISNIKLDCVKFLESVQVKQFRFKANPHMIQFGVIAQDLLNTDICVNSHSLLRYDQQKNIYGVDYLQFIPVLIKCVQKLMKNDVGTQDMNQKMINDLLIFREDFKVTYNNVIGNTDTLIDVKQKLHKQKNINDELRKKMTEIENENGMLKAELALQKDMMNKLSERLDKMCDNGVIEKTQKQLCERVMSPTRNKKINITFETPNKDISWRAIHGEAPQSATIFTKSKLQRNKSKALTSRSIITDSYSARYGKIFPSSGKMPPNNGDF